MTFFVVALALVAFAALAFEFGRRWERAAVALIDDCPFGAECLNCRSTYVAPVVHSRIEAGVAGGVEVYG